MKDIYGMRIAIVGSRNFNNYDLLKSTLLNKFDVSSIVEIISGGAKGADTLGAKFAKEFSIPLTEFLPDWNLHGKSAGYIRNKDIVNNSDIVVAFWDGVSKGTKHSIDMAIKLNKRCEVIIYE